MVKVAVLGTGSIGTRHLKVLRSFQDVQVIAIPKRVEKQSLLEKEGFSVAADLAHASRMGATFAIVASDTKQHVPDALVALEYDMDVLVEKPLGVDAVSAVPLRVASKKRGKNIFVGCVLRFSESLTHFRALLEEIAPVYSVRIECQSWLPDWRPERNYKESYSARPLEGGVLRDLIHEIDYAGWIFGWPDTVEARLDNFGILNIDVEERAELWWKTKRGVAVSTCLDYLSPVPRRKMTAFGKQGVLEWDAINKNVRLEKPGMAPRIVSSQQDYEDLFYKQAKAFLENNTETIATLEDGLKALEICDAARHGNH